MAQWFESAVQYDKMQENGTVKKTTEKNLFDSLSFTECEERTITKVKPYISGEFTVKAVKKTKIAEVFWNEDADRYYLVNTAFVNYDEKTGTETQTVTQILVQASDFDSAVAAFKDGMKDTMADWKIISVAETPYMGVYPADLGGADDKGSKND